MISTGQLVVVVNTYIRFGLRIDTRTERTMIDVDIFIIQKVRDPVIHLKLDEEQWKTALEIIRKRVIR